MFMPSRLTRLLGHQTTKFPFSISQEQNLLAPGNQTWPFSCPAVIIILCNIHRIHINLIEINKVHVYSSNYSPFPRPMKHKLTARNFMSVCQSAISTCRPSSLSSGVNPFASEDKQFTARSTESWSPTTPTLLKTASP